MEKGKLVIKSLKEQVYEYLREEFRHHRIEPGSTINMEKTTKELGISKTPLREALLQLESDGFVTIVPRVGIYVNTLSEEEIANYYEVIGALECSAVLSGAPNFTTEVIECLKELNEEIRKAIADENNDLFVQKNFQFHNTFVKVSKNETLLTITDNLRRRLYDFPRHERWIKEWDWESLNEHDKFIEMLESGKYQEAGVYIRDVHWCYTSQENFVKNYYFNDQGPEK